MGKVDKSILVLSGLFFIVFSYLFMNFGPNHIETSGSVIGEITIIDNLVKRKGNKSIFWNEINQGQAVYDGDRIFSDTNSTADIQFQDKTILKVPSETLIVLSKDKEGLAIDLQHGLVDIYFGENFKTAKIKSKGKIVQINGANGKVEIVKSRSGLSIVPSSGDIEILHNKKRIILNKKTSFEMSNIKDESPNIIKNINLILSSPPQMNLYKENQIKAKVSSNLKGEIEFEISKSPSFTRLLKGKDLDLIPEEVTYKVSSPGIYYIRATQKLNNKTIGKSKTKKIRFYADLNNEDLFPLSDIETIASKSGGIEINWKARKNLDYQIRFRDPDGNTTIYKSPTNSLILPVIKTGDYSYSVRALIKGFQWSGQHKIKVKVDNYLKPLTPMPNAIVMLETFPNVKKFEWEGLKNQKYLFTLRKKTSDIDGEVLEKKMIKGTSHKFKFLEPGSYEWSLEHEKFKGIRIEKTAFLIQMPVAIKLKPVDNKKIILSTFNQNILFKWIAHKLVEKEDLTLLVSSKESFKDNIKVKQGKNRAQVKLNQLGKYYWKISPKKEKEDEVRYFADSKIQTFSLDYPLSKIKPSIAKSQFINKDIVSKKKGHKIKFKGVRFAKNYQVEIYADKKFKKLVTKTTTNKTTLYWISKRDGQHFIRVKTLDIWGRWSKYSNTGQLIFPISPLLE